MYNTCCFDMGSQWNKENRFTAGRTLTFRKGDGKAKNAGK